MLQTTNNDLRMVTVKQPVGVVAAITPWNFPFRYPLLKAVDRIKSYPGLVSVQHSVALSPAA